MRTHLDIAHEGTLGEDDRTRMSFDENSIAHLMSVLTDLYSDPELAVIREYSTNALDSHRAAGTTDPIEVELPGSLSPVFKVRDHGVGMDADMIAHNFSKYGWSSKRDTDNEVGMLGLGCKAGLAYTSQFTLVAVKHEIRVVVLVTRDADGCGAVQIVEAAPAPQVPNGVEIQIPVKHVGDFNETAQEFFSYWDPGSVLIDGQPPEACVWTSDEYIMLDPDVIVSKDRHHGQTDKIVMGNVPYPVDREHRLTPAGEDTAAHAVVRVDIGLVNFTPSREALNYTKRTEEVCHDTRQFIGHNLLKSAQDQLDAIDNGPEAYWRARQWKGLVKYGTLKWRGIELPPDAILAPEEFGEFRPGIWDSKVYKRSRLELNELHATKFGGYGKGMDNHVFITGHGPSGIGEVAREKIAAALEYFGLTPNKTKVFITPSMFGQPWVGDQFQVTWDEIKAVDVGTVTTRLTRPAKWRIITHTRTRKRAYGSDGTTESYTPSEPFYVDKIEGFDTIITMTGDQGRAAPWITIARALPDDAVLVVVNKRLEKQFAKLHPKSIPFLEWLPKRITEFHDSLSLGERALINNFTDYPWMRIDPLEFVDPLVACLTDEIRGTRKTVNADLNHLEQLWRKYLQYGPNATPWPQVRSGKRTLVSLQKRIHQRYPLIQQVTYSSNTEGVTEYVNSVYQSRHGGH